jgi:hypothetical protein
VYREEQSAKKKRGPGAGSSRPVRGFVRSHTTDRVAVEQLEGSVNSPAMSCVKENKNLCKPMSTRILYLLNVSSRCLVGRATRRLLVCPQTLTKKVLVLGPAGYVGLCVRV